MTSGATSSRSPSLSPAERAFIEQMPKAELHVHLEGSVYPELLLQLAEKHGQKMPFDDAEGAREWFKFRDFPHFIDVYIEVCRNLRDEDDYALITSEMGRRAAAENIRYMEVTYSPSSILNPRVGGSAEVAWAGIQEGIRVAKRDHGVELQFILDPVRGRQEEDVMQLARWFEANIGDGLVGFGLGGLEFGNLASRYREAFDLARSAGARLSIHAGETDGPASIRDALSIGAERLGHGVRSIEDEALVAELADMGMLLEVSPTSNVQLGIYPSYAEHPIRKLYEAGVPVTVNSDDPPMVGTTLTNEYLVLADHFGFTLDELVGLERAAVEHAFLPPERARELLQSFDEEVRALRVRLDLADGAEGSGS